MSSGPTPSPSSSGNDTTGQEGLLVILGVVILLLAVIAVLLFIVLMIKRNRLRKRKFRPHDAGKKTGQVNATFDNGDAQVLSFHPVPSSADLSPETPSPVSSPASKVPQMDPIPLTSLINYVGENKLNGALVDQWSGLPQDLTQPATVASKNENKPKNRYRNIIAYDEHRVVLELEEGDNFSDYVNASFIKGFQNEKAFIASQGPTTNSIVDFWRMIWQEDIRKISMVANVIEEGRMKCLHYWPTLGDDPLEEGNFIISTISETEKDSYTLRKLGLEKKGAGSRELYMFHYTEWPDRDVPSDASTLIRYIRDIHALQTEGPDTILVHCSYLPREARIVPKLAHTLQKLAEQSDTAGAGRTGVFMAIDTQLQRAVVKGDVDIFNYALDMRKARPWMIQMPIQYLFVHEALLEAIMCKDTLIHKSQLSVLIDRFLEPQFETGKSLIEQHFQTLNSVSVKVTEYFYKMQAGMKDGNVAKNRYPSVIPIDRFRPKLLIGDEENDLKDYICATFLNRYSKVNGLMATQMPLPSTITDFWQLIHDYKITALVMLNENSAVDETIGQYWPSDSSDTQVTGKFSVSEIMTETADHYVIRDLSLKVMREDDDAESEQEEPLTVRQFQLTNWKASARNPSSISGFLDFILMIKSWMEEDPRESHLPLVHCLNGIGRSGVFCSVFNTLEQLEKQDSVNIFNIIKALRRKQPMLVKTQDEYELIFRLVNLFVIRSETEQVSQSAGNGTPVNQSYENITIGKQDEKEEAEKEEEEAGDVAEDATENEVEGEEREAEQ